MWLLKSMRMKDRKKGRGGGRRADKANANCIVKILCELQVTKLCLCVEPFHSHLNNHPLLFFFPHLPTFTIFFLFPICLSFLPSISLCILSIPPPNHHVYGTHFQYIRSASLSLSIGLRTALHPVQNLMVTSINAR